MYRHKLHPGSREDHRKFVLLLHNQIYHIHNSRKHKGYKTNEKSTALAEAPPMFPKNFHTKLTRADNNL